MASVKKVSDIVAEIAAASREQSSGIEQVNRAVMQMDELTQQNAALVEQATASSQAMADQARELNEMMSRYQVSGEVGTGRSASRGSACGSADGVDVGRRRASDGSPLEERVRGRSAPLLPASRPRLPRRPRRRASRLPPRAVARTPDWQEF